MALLELLARVGIERVVGIRGEGYLTSPPHSRAGSIAGYRARSLLS